jgi:hypothetical protein
MKRDYRDSLAFAASAAAARLRADPIRWDASMKKRHMRSSDSVSSPPSLAWDKSKA